MWPHSATCRHAVGVARAARVLALASTAYRERARDDETMMIGLLDEAYATHRRELGARLIVGGLR